MDNEGLDARVKKEGCWEVKSQVKGHSARERAAEGTEGTEKTEGAKGEVLCELRNDSLG